MQYLNINQDQYIYSKNNASQFGVINWEYEILIHTYQLGMVCLEEVVAAGSGCSSFVHGLLLVLLNKRKPNGLFIE